MKSIVTEATLVQRRQQGLALISPLKAKVTAILVKTADDYIQADEILGRIREAKREWEGRINPIIEPIRSGLDQLYTLRSDIITPLTELEGMVKERMRAFKIEEARLLKEQNDETERKRLELERQLQLKEQAEAKAKTPAMVNKILESKARLQQAIADTQQNTVQPIKGSHSAPKKTKHWRVENMASFLKYLIEQEQSEFTTLVTVDQVQMNAYFKMCKDKLEAGKEWMPGVTVFEDINIAGR